MSLGSECPFAFRRQDTLAQTLPAAEWPSRQQAMSLPLPGNRCVSPPSAPVRADRAMRPSELPGRGETDTGARRPAACSTGEELTGPALLRAARLAADNGRLDEADALCGQMLSQDLASAEAHYLRGVVRQAQGRIQRGTAEPRKGPVPGSQALPGAGAHDAVGRAAAATARRRRTTVGGPSKSHRGRLNDAIRHKRIAPGQPACRCVLEPHRRAGRPVLPQPADRAVHCRNCPVFSLPASSFSSARRRPSTWTSGHGSSLKLDRATVDEMRSLLVFRVGTEWLALDARSVIEVVGATPHPPHTASHGPAAVGSGQHPR